MRKRLFALCICLLLIFPVLPVFSSSTRFVASRNSDVFHKESCFYVDRIISSNKVYYETIDQAERAGKRGCSRCNPGSGKSASVTTEPAKSDTSSYLDGYRDGYQNGKEFGYTEGVAAGKAEVEQDITAQIKKAENDAAEFAFLSSFALVAPLITFLTCHYWPKKKQKLDDQIVRLSKELDFYKSNQEETMLVMNHVAKCANTSTLEVAQMLYISYLKNMGYTESEARAQLTRIIPKQTKTK